MKFCSACGFQLTDGATLCPKCGIVLPAEPSPSASYQGTAQQAAFGAPQPYAHDAFVTIMYRRFQTQFSGQARHLFLIAFGSMLLCLILWFCTTMKVSALGIIELRYSFISMITEGGQGETGVGVLIFFIILGPLALAASIIMMLLPFIRNTLFTPRNLTLAKVATIYSFLVDALIMILLVASAGSSSYDLAKGGLTFLGWLYLIAAITAIVTVIMASSRVKQATQHMATVGQYHQII